MRKHIGSAVLASAAFVTIGLAASDFAAADQVTYAIDPLQSALTLSGGELTGSPHSQQGAGSLSTSFSGSIVADRTGNTILFPSNGGSAVTALNSGNWTPDDDGFNGTDPANYGRQAPWEVAPSITTFEAIRGLVIDLWDDNSGVPSTISGSGTFNSTSFFLHLDGGESDTLIGSSGGVEGLSLVNKEAGNSNSNGLSSVTSDGLTETLTLKFSTGGIGYSVSTPGDSSFSLTGTLVATRLVPEPGALGLIAIGGAALLGRRRRPDA